MPAYTRHNEVTVLDSKPDRIEAHYFNRVLTALKRTGEPIRFKIPKHSHLDIILQQDAWIVIDRVLHDMPVAAWTNFQTEGRDNLHKAVPCDIRIYHFAARMVLKSVLDAIETTLRQQKKTKKRKDYVAALEAASVQQDIVPFTP